MHDKTRSNHLLSIDFETSGIDGPIKDKEGNFVKRSDGSIVMGTDHHLILQGCFRLLDKNLNLIDSVSGYIIHEEAVLAKRSNTETMAFHEEVHGDAKFSFMEVYRDVSNLLDPDFQALVERTAKLTPEEHARVVKCLKSLKLLRIVQDSESFESLSPEDKNSINGSEDDYHQFKSLMEGKTNNDALRLMGYTQDEIELKAILDNKALQIHKGPLNIFTTNEQMADAVIAMLKRNLPNLEEYGFDATHVINLLGKSVGFDHGFIKAQLPELSRYIGHQEMNVSVFKLAGSLWGNGYKLQDMQSSHFADDDCLSAELDAGVAKKLFNLMPDKGTTLKDSVDDIEHVLKNRQ